MVDFWQFLRYACGIDATEGAKDFMLEDDPFEVGRTKLKSDRREAQMQSAAFGILQKSVI